MQGRMSWTSFLKCLTVNEGLRSFHIKFPRIILLVVRATLESEIINDARFHKQFMKS